MNKIELVDYKEKNLIAVIKNFGGGNGTHRNYILQAIRELEEAYAEADKEEDY